MLVDRIIAARRVFYGQMHGFFHMVNVLPASADGVAFIAQSLEETLARTSTAAQA